MSFEGQNNSPFLFSDVTANNSAAVLADMNNNLVGLINALTSSSALIAVLEALVTATQAINTTLGTINTTLGVGNSYLNNIHGDLGAINVDLQNIYSAILSGNTNTSNIYSELITINTTLGVGNNNTAAINSDLMAMNGVLGSIDNDLKNINTSIVISGESIVTQLTEIAADLAPWVVDSVPYTLAQSAYNVADVLNTALLTNSHTTGVATQNNLCYTNTSVAGNPSFSIAQSLAPFYYADMGDQFSIAGAIFKQADVLNTAL